VRKRSTRYADGDAGWWNGRRDIFLEHRSHDIDDQHEHGRYIQRDSDRYERVHRFRLRHLNGRFFTNRGGQQSGCVRKHASRYSYGNTEWRYSGLHLFLEHRSDNIDDQLKHGGHLQCDGNRFEGLHGLGHRDLDD
jgi:hypothetical protein